MPWAKRGDDEVIGVGRYVRVGRVGAVLVIFVAGAPVCRLASSDGVGLRVVLAGFEAVELVSQAEVAASGLVAEATFHRDCRAFAKGGEAALRRRAASGGQAPSKLTAAALIEVERLCRQGETNVAIGARLGMSEASVRAGRRQLGLPSAREMGSESLPFAAASSEPAVEAAPIVERAAAPEAARAAVEEQASFDATEAAIALATTPETAAKQVAEQRNAELFLARMGALEEQSALFPPIERASHAGVLLGLSLLTLTGLLEEARKVLGALPNGLYGVRSIVTTLIAMALLRIKRPEQLKGFDPTALGAVVGLARAPEMKTLRRKLALLSRDEQKVKELVRAMAKHHVARAKEAVAFLYVDGHVRPYFGDKKLGKAHHAAMRIALPATTDYWVCDDRGAPVLVVITEGNTAMTRAMPALLAEAREAVGPGVRPTVVFDRGGFSATLFKQIVDAGFDLLTYRKGKQPRFRRADFETGTIRRAGKDREVLLRDGHVRIKGYGNLRCVAVLRPDGKQTHVLTTREDLDAKKVLERMFSRWQQENFFKYLHEQYAFDALWTYQSTDADPSRTVPNPERRKLDARLGELRRELQRCKASFGDVALAARLAAEHRAEDLQRQLDAGRELAELEAKIANLAARRKKLPMRVAVGGLPPERRIELARAPMLLGDLVKMTAFHIESMLVAALAPHLRRAADEARAAVADILSLPGRLEPRDGEIVVTLQRAAAPRYTRALQALCESVNALEPVFPETSTRLRFAVEADDDG